MFNDGMGFWIDDKYCVIFDEKEFEKRYIIW